MTLSASSARIPKSASESSETTLPLVSRTFCTRGSASLLAPTISTAALIYATSCVTNSLSATLLFRAFAVVTIVAGDLINAVKVRVAFPGNEYPYHLPDTLNAEKFPGAVARSS